MMKKSSSLLLICALFLLLAACGKQIPASTDEAISAETLAPVETRAEHTALLSLESNPTTGYEWTEEIENKEILALISSDFVFSEENEALSGAPGVQEFLFEGLSAGTTKVVMTYARSFELGAAEQRTFEFTVSQALEVSYREIH